MTKLLDLTGQRVGQLSVVSYLGGGKWLCQCDCGEAKSLAVGGLRQRRTQSCGCVRRAKTIARNQQSRRDMHRVDLTGQIFGKLHVVDRAVRASHWNCRCECGTEKVVQQHNLTRGMTRSCGCLLREQNARFRRFESREARDQATNEKKRARRHSDPDYARHIREICSASEKKTYRTPEGRVRAANKLTRRRLACKITPISAVDWLRLVEAWDCRCAYCGQLRKLTQDHVVPLKNGGAHVIENVVPACLSCNCQKSDFDLEEALVRLSCRDFHKRREAALLLLKDISHA